MLDIELKKLTAKKLKYYKNSFSFVRNLINIIISLIHLNRASRKEKEAKYHLQTGSDTQMYFKGESYEALVYYLTKRRKFRFALNNIFQSILRFFMLYKNMKLPGSDALNPIMISLVGVVSQTLGFIKYLFEKENHSFYLKEEDLTHS